MRRAPLTALCLCLSAPLAAQVDITLIDIGQGDSILVTLPPGSDGTRKRMLIDGGRSAADDSALIQFLDDQNVQRLDFVVLTHAHDDHYNGLTAVLNKFPVTEVLWTGELRTNIDSFDNFATAMNRAGTRTVVTPGVTRTSQSAKVEVLLAGGHHPNTNNGEDINNDSLSMMLTYKSVKILFTGDIESDGGQDLVNRYCSPTKTTCRKLDADIIKIPHHGSSDLSARLASLVTADVVLVSAGFENRQHHHPTTQALRTYAQFGATQFYSTSASGTNHVTLTIQANGTIVRPTFPASQQYSAWRVIDVDEPSCPQPDRHEGYCAITVAQGSVP